MRCFYRCLPADARVAVLVGFLVLGACDDAPIRHDALVADGGPEVVLMNFAEPFSLDPLPAGWYHRLFFARLPMTMGFATKDGVAAIRLETNNSASGWVQVEERKIKVLLVESEPRWEFRFIRNVFERDPAVSVTVCLLRPGVGPIAGQGYLKELPRGKCVCELDSTTDIFKAKEILKGHMCIMGDVPASLLAIGTAQQVEDYCKKLIDVVGEGGGFILSSGCGVPIDAQFDNMKEMIDTAKNYLPPR